MRRAGGPLRWHVDAHLAVERSGVLAAIALAARPPDLRGGRRDVSAVRRRRAHGDTGQCRDRTDCGVTRLLATAALALVAAACSPPAAPTPSVSASSTSAS